MHLVRRLTTLAVVTLLYILSAHSPVDGQVICGQQLSANAMYRGVAALSNGNDRDNDCGGRGFYGLQYQCVEYIRRFYAVALGVIEAKADLPTDVGDKSPWRLDAKDFFNATNAAKLGLDRFVNGESAQPPEPDDILVFGPSVPDHNPYGHVAIVKSLASASVDVIEQNFSKTGIKTLPLTRSNGVYTIPDRGSYPILGWLRRPSNSQVVFSNFGPGDTYIVLGGWGVLSAGPNVPFSSNAGESFTPGGNFRLERIEVAMGIAQGAESFSPNEVDVTLMTDEGGAPGTVIETLRFDNLGLSGSLLPPLAKDSVLRPVLTAGTRYWLVASAPVPDTLLVWHQNLINSIGPHACSGPCIGTQIGQWFIHNDVQGAFRITGTPIP